MFEDAIRYPWTGEQRVANIAIGGIFTLLGILLLPLLVPWGYYVRVLKRVGGGETETAPGFDDVGDLLANGVVACCIGFVYVIVPMVLLSVVGSVPMFFGVGLGASEDILGFLIVGGLILLGVLFFTIQLVSTVLLPAGVAAYALTDDVTAAVSPSTVWTIAGDKRYLKGWLVAFLINLLSSIVLQMVAATIIGFVFVPFLSFYSQVASTYAVGVGIADISLEKPTRSEYRLIG
jgi:hypothetical protein